MRTTDRTRRTQISTDGNTSFSVTPRLHAGWAEAGITCTGGEQRVPLAGCRVDKTTTPVKEEMPDMGPAPLGVERDGAGGSFRA
jgi:hypothetical protein